MNIGMNLVSHALTQSLGYVWKGSVYKNGILLTEPQHLFTICAFSYVCGNLAIFSEQFFPSDTSTFERAAYKAIVCGIAIFALLSASEQFSTNDIIRNFGEMCVISFSSVAAGALSSCFSWGLHRLSSQPLHWVLHRLSFQRLQVDGDSSSLVGGS